MRIGLIIVALLVTVAACDAQERARETGGEVTPVVAAEAALRLGRRSSDPDVREAAGAIARGSPWLGTLRVAPALATPARRTPEALLVAARAAAGWEGWSEVERLLGGQPWLDTLAGGEGRELLARAALARGGDSSIALGHAEAAVRAGGTGRVRGTRLVLLARALDRASRLDSAAATYASAAALLPDVADWLRLRAAGVTADDAARRALFAAVRDSVARARIPSTDALALERAGRRDDAAAAYARSGDRVGALRLRLAGAADDAARASLRGELLALVRDRAGTAEARRAIDLLDDSKLALGPDDELAVARAAWRGGLASRAVRGFARATTLSPRDRYDYGIALGRLGRWGDSRAQLGRVTDPSLRGEAAYHAARARYHMGDAAAARRELAAVARQHASDANAATLALLLLADLQGDDRRDGDARTTLLDLVRRHPTSARAAEAAFRAAMIAIAAGSHASAARELDALAERHPRSSHAIPAVYWSGRAHQARGDAATARARWTSVLERDPLSYYAMLARQRLRASPWVPEGGGTVPRLEAVDDVVDRVRTLDALGMDVEARFETDALVRDASASASDERLRATAAALREIGRTSPSIALGWKLLERGARDAAAYRLVFPVVHRERLVAESRARGLDPALVAALIRQESSFTPGARSPAGARGLMQIMPEVGRALARSQRVPVWDPAMLYDPDASLALGTAHLATFLRQYDDPSTGSGQALARALAAYNAGPSRVRRWVTKGGMSDPELFAERIPFDETRDYVRIVQRNATVYRVLYDW